MAKRTIGERIYRRLLRVYPRDFSEDYADEMACLYRDRARGEWSDEPVAGARRRSGAHGAQGTGLDAGAGRATCLAYMAADASPCADCHSDPGDRRRREHRRLQRRARRAPEAVAVSGCGSSRRSLRGQSRAGGRLLPRVAAQLPVVGRSRPELRRIGDLQRRGLHCQRSMAIRSASLESPLPLAVQGARRCADRRATTDCRRRAARRGTGSPARGAIMAPRLWRSLVGHRPLDHPERHTPSNRRRRAGRVSRGRAHANRLGQRCPESSSRSRSIPRRAAATTRSASSRGCARAFHSIKAGTRCIASAPAWRKNSRLRIEIGACGSSDCTTRCSTLASVCRCWFYLARLASCS